jgi:DnaJ-class molecular chaperone
MSNRKRARALDCRYCGGTGLVPKQHEYPTEWLTCEDCEGSGKETSK